MNIYLHARLIFGIFNKNNPWYICIYQIKVVPLHIEKER